MVLPQAMAWVQYWFRVVSLKFCGKSKKNCGDISQVSPAFCMYAIQTFSHNTCIFHFGICHAANTTNHDSDIQLCRTIKNPNGEQTQMQFESFFREQPRCKMAQNIAWFWCLVFFVFLCTSMWQCIWFCNMCVATFYLRSQILLANMTHTLLQKQNDCMGDQPRRQTENSCSKTSDWLHLCEKRRCVRPWSLTELEVKWQYLSKLHHKWSIPTSQKLQELE